MEEAIAKEQSNREYFRKYREKNKEHIREIQKSYLEKNKENIIQKRKKWIEENPEKIKEIRRNARIQTRIKKANGEVRVCHYIFDNPYYPNFGKECGRINCCIHNKTNTVAPIGQYICGAVLKKREGTCKNFLPCRIHLILKNPDTPPLSHDMYVKIDKERMAKPRVRKIKETVADKGFSLCPILTYNGKGKVCGRILPCSFHLIKRFAGE